MIPRPGKIFLIGGGEIHEGDTALIDRSIRASAPPGSSFVFFPTAADDHPEYSANINQVFGRRFRVRSIVASDSAQTTRRALRNARVIYLGGGKTELLLKRFHDMRLLPALRSALARGVVIIGMSAGAEALAAKYVDFSKNQPMLRSGWGIASIAVLVHATATKHRGARTFMHCLDNMPLFSISERTAVVIQAERIRKVGSGRLWQTL